MLDPGLRGDDPTGADDAEFNRTPAAPLGDPSDQLSQAEPQRANAIVATLASIPDVGIDAEDVRARDFRRSPKILGVQLTDGDALATLLEAFRLFTAGSVALDLDVNRVSTRANGE